MMAPYHFTFRDDVVHVIDSGRAKEMQYDAQSNMAMLVEGWASKARCSNILLIVSSFMAV